jgi:hypothetical protein
VAGSRALDTPSTGVGDGLLPRNDAFLGGDRYSSRGRADMAACSTLHVAFEP